MIAGFELGCRAPLLVRREHVGVPQHPAWRLCYASDLHLTQRRAFLVDGLVAAVADERPDVVMLGGDLVDRRDGVPPLHELVTRLHRHAPVFAVPGNHDRRHAAELRRAVHAAGGHWLPEHDATLTLHDRPTLRLHATPRTATTDERGALRVLVGHHPAAAARAALHGYDVAFAGHLHGGQCVWWQRRDRLYPGAWFSRWNGLRFDLDGTALLVSRGVADTLPIRSRCPREVISCELARGSDE